MAGRHATTGLPRHRRRRAEMARAAIALLATSLAVVAAAVTVPARAADDDPLRSPLWSTVAARHLTGGPIVHDPAVKVIVPTVVENQAQVPVTVDARGLRDVIRVVVVADLNPIQHVLTLTTGRAAPYVAFRLKVEQGTPVRAAAQTADGVWHVGSVYLDAAGGGCSAPAVGRQKPDWVATLGQTQGRVWREADGSARLRLRIKHPMDTGLARDNTPAFFIEHMDLKDASGAVIGGLDLYEPVAEDPTLTLMVDMPAADGEVIVDGRDNQGSIFRARVPAPWRSS